MSYELRYKRRGESIPGGKLPLVGDRESAVTQAKLLAENLSHGDTKPSGFYVRGPKGEVIPIEVPETSVSN